jgi:hypothetical protein
VEAATATRRAARLTVTVAAPAKRSRLMMRVRGPLPGCATVLVRRVRRGAARVRVPTVRAHHRPLRRGRYLVEILRPDARVVARRILVVPRPGRHPKLLRVVSRTRVLACAPAAASTATAAPATPVAATVAAGILSVGGKGSRGGDTPSAAAFPPLPPPGPATSVVPVAHHGIPGWAFALAFAAWAAAVAVLVARAGHPRRSRRPNAY